MDTTGFNNLFGDMDLFLLDLILKGKADPANRVLDAGCGSGRNLIYFLNEGFEVKALDNKESEVHAANFLSRSFLGKDICSVGDLRNIPFEQDSFDFILCSRVLHFSDSPDDFLNMLNELNRVLSSNGTLYISMASKIGFEAEVKELGQGKAQFPEGSIRFVLTKELLEELELKWKHVEIPRTIHFAREHAETTLVLAPI